LEIEGEYELFKNSKKVPYIELLPIIVLSFIIVKLIDNIGAVGDFFSKFFSIIGAFIWGFCIAYILNPVMKYFERKFHIKRVWSLVITYTLFLGILVLFITIVTPKVIKSAGELASSIPEYVDIAQDWLNDNADKFEALNRLNVNLEEKFMEGMQHASEFLTSKLNVILSQAINITYSVAKAILGIVISIYILMDKEKFKSNFKRFIYAILRKDRATYFLKTCSEVNLIFSKFILGKALDSLIIGIMCFIGLGIMRVHFASLLSVIVGITNMIPYFGPFLGMVPAFIITIFYSPIQALWVLIFIFALQQFDGWYLGPKILGDQVGLSPFWVIAAIIIGGGAFGVWGMFLGVPIAATIKTFLDRFIQRRLAEKQLDVS
jgi:predicted PurR-regulated permease PerM